MQDRRKGERRKKGSAESAERSGERSGERSAEQAPREAYTSGSSDAVMESPEAGTTRPVRGPGGRFVARGRASDGGEPSAAGFAPEVAAVDVATAAAATESGGEGGNGAEAGTRVAAAQPLAPPPLSGGDLTRLLSGEHHSPHAVLGAHHAVVRGTEGVVVRAMQPDAEHAEVVLEDGSAHEMRRVAGQLFAVFIPRAPLPLAYRLRFRFADGNVWERGDAYRFLPTIGDVDLHLFGEGTHRKLWEKLGAHPRTVDGVAGVAFAVWAPNARRVSVVGDFNRWDGRVHPMRMLGSSGVWELFVPEIGDGAIYKYELLTREGVPRIKADPFAFKQEQAPATSSIVVDLERYGWGDEEWMRTRDQRDPTREPLSIYEVHLGSWARVPEEGNRRLTYREIAPRLADHVSRLGFTHVEFLPLAEHPFEGSWGYQISNYFAPTSRFGTPDDFRFLVDTLHQRGIGVIMDWVPAHFPKDDWALRRFDGTALYEHEDPRLGEHPDWGTLIFNYGRAEVRNFLVANALFWLEEFHIDGLRVDAVASMLYLDYSRKAGEWLRNRFGGRENLEAIDFIRQVNGTLHAEHPGCFTVAEESTAWPGVTKPASEGGLGYTFKWNMGWMHDTLKYFTTDPVYRRHDQDKITFAMMYEYSERFIMPLSHDEVVHLKKSLLGKMPGDEWQQLANLRALLGYQWTRPGKQLVFMGTELAPYGEWNHDTSLDWHLADDTRRRGFAEYLATLGRIYRERSCFWRRDHEPEGFSWIDVADRDNSVLSYLRRDGMEHAIVVLNLTPVPREDYRIGAPAECCYVELLNSDDARFAGSGYPTRQRVDTESSPFHGYERSIRLSLPPLSMLVLAPER